jgi:hypothetical protein
MGMYAIAIKDSGSRKVTLELIPGHHRISGIEEADKLGKEGINKLPSDHPVGIPFAVGKEFIRVTSDRTT